MSPLFIARVFIAACVLSIASSVAAQAIISVPRSGSMSYRDWQFSWNVGSQSEGLELRGVYYRGIQMLYKASMPVIRVKYRGNASSVTAGCGPYADQLNWGNMIVPAGASSKVVVRFFTGMMEIAVYSRIGGYRLYQAWYFHQDGRLQPVLYSRGWSCGENPKNRRNHRHHPYWRFDFDIEAAGNNFIQEFRRPSGSGNYTTSLYTLERNAFRSSTSEDVFWTVGRTGSPRHVVIRYSSNELRDPPGSPWFAYSNKDAGARLYRGSEDAGWPFGALGHLGFDTPAENINRQDVVFWSVGHLSHNWTLRDQLFPQWHSTGPVIRAVW